MNKVIICKISNYYKNCVEFHLIDLISDISFFCFILGALTTAEGSVKDFKNFIASVLGQLTALTPSLSVMEVNEKYWKVEKPLEIFYRFT